MKESPKIEIDIKEVMKFLGIADKEYRLFLKRRRKGSENRDQCGECRCDWLEEEA